MARKTKGTSPQSNLAGESQSAGHHHADTQATSSLEQAKSDQLALEPRAPVQIDLRTLLEAGAHYGHQTQRWNPKMLPNIFGVRNNVHIINLDLTLKQWERARKYVSDVIGRGGSILFVGTKNQARDIVRIEAQRCGAFHVTSRWLGGMLSNFQTMKNSIERMRKLEELLVQSQIEDSKIKLSKKEKLTISRDLAKLEGSLGGIRNLKRVPDVLFIVDIVKEAIAVSEARRLHIPVVAMVDTNSDPGIVDFPIACNDDSSKTIRLISCGICDAVLEGKAAFDARMAANEQQKKDKADKDQGSNGNAENGEHSLEGATAIMGAGH